jgi:hypothetical protein
MWIISQAVHTLTISIREVVGDAAHLSKTRNRRRIEDQLVRPVFECHEPCVMSYRFTIHHVVNVSSYIAFSI